MSKLKLFKSEKFEYALFMSLFLLMALLSVILFVRDIDFIKNGEGTDLNKIMANNEKMPTYTLHGYVVYECKVPLGNYCYEQEYTGNKPTGDKGYYYAFLDDSGAVISVETDNKSVISDIKALENGEVESITVKGKLCTNRKKADKYMQEQFGSIADGENIYLTSYTIRTTTSAEAKREVIAGFVVGILGALGFFIRLKKASS